MDLKINSKIANKIYDDVFHPAAVQMGEAIARIPRAINAALSPLDQWIFRNISEDDTPNMQKYCIIFGTASQAEHPFPAGCYFYTHF